MKNIAVLAASLLATSLMVSTPAAAKAVRIDWGMVNQLSKAAPSLNRDALVYALKAAACGQSKGANASRLSVIDYSVSSSKKRLWVFDLKQRSLLMNEWVAHGVNSGQGQATNFSNSIESRKTSIGVFKTAETYSGKHGYSLRLDGLEKGWNHNARQRAIVIHGADYVDPVKARGWGRLGRSWGCPAVRKSVNAKLIDTIKGGSLLVAWYPNSKWMASSELMNCPAAQIKKTMPKKAKPASRSKLLITQSNSPKPQLHMMAPELQPAAPPRLTIAASRDLVADSQVAMNDDVIRQQAVSNLPVSF